MTHTPPTGQQLTPEREQHWRAMAAAAETGPTAWPEQADRYFVQGGIGGIRELLAEIDRLRAELAARPAAVAAVTETGQGSA
jgi:hypothetical protein